MYFGPIGHHCEDLVRHIEAHPTTSPRPLRVNPATWMLNELEAERARVSAIVKGGLFPALRREGDAEERVEGASPSLLRMQASSHLLYETFRASQAYVNLTQDLTRSKTAHAMAGGRKSVPSAKVGDLTRFLAVLERTFTDSYRDLGFNGSRFTTLIMLGFIFGLLFYGLDYESSQGGALSMVGVLQSLSSASGVLSLATQVVLLYKFRPIFYRERSLGMYNTATYYVTMSLKEIVYLGCLCVVFTPVVYAIIGFRFDQISAFFETLVCVFLTGLWLSLMSQFFAASFPDSQTAEFFVGELMLASTIFNGVFTSGVQNYGPAFRWVTYLNPLFLVNAPLALNQAHCFDAAADASEAERLDAGCPTITVLDDGVERLQTVEGYVEQLVDTTYADRWKYYTAIIAIAVGYQILGQVLGHSLDFQKR